ncbi:sensor histidine kinase [Gehongia tenuis]|uniref:histidine kinase n=1 Tax=Gehongia tenuis TaxID=2763655 RepID=A0A926HNN9_9FIRM|nr:HAMP domain-containing sensor histidine kinase [Gehongia tenuis]MBC8530358.1 HAMP domain-containing histidine kinase [Gehongia tenuis]
MAAAIVILALTGVVLAALLALDRISIRRAAGEMKRINEGDTNQRVHLTYKNRALDGLFEEVNHTLDLRRRERIDYEGRQRTFRRQITNISHDLRTPLTSILGYTDLLGDPELSEEERREYLGVVERRARALQTLVESFYDMSRLEGGEYPLHMELVDLHEILSQVLAAYYGDLSGRFEVAVDLEEGLPCVWADRTIASRMFANLVQNALRHGVNHLWIRQRLQKGEIVTAFGNEAPEMTKVELTRVFERFYTGDGPRTGQRSGLGLTIVKEFAGAMGHRTEAWLAEGVFWVEIHWRTLKQA